MKKVRNSREYVAALCKLGHLSLVGEHECRDCRVARSRCYFMHNRDRHLAECKAYADENRDHIRARNRAYSKAHPEENRARYNEWRANNRERANATFRAWYARNSAIHLARTRRWEKENPGAKRLISAEGKNRRRIRQAGNGGSHTRAEWLAIVALQERKCAHCGEVKPLTRDHIFPVLLGGSDDASNIQGLCRPCNSRKGAKIAKEIPNGRT